MFESQRLGRLEGHCSILLSAVRKQKLQRRESSSWLGFVREAQEEREKAKAVPALCPQFFWVAAFGYPQGKVATGLILLPDKMGGETSSVFQWT